MSYLRFNNDCLTLNFETAVPNFSDGHLGAGSLPIHKLKGLTLLKPERAPSVVSFGPDEIKLAPGLGVS